MITKKNLYLVSRLLLVIVTCSALSLNKAFADCGGALVTFRNQYPLATMHSLFAPDFTCIPKEGAEILKAQFSLSNTLDYEEEGGFLIDTETRNLDLSFEKSVTSRASVGFVAPLQWRGKGVTDSLIDNWHQKLGFPRGDRDEIEDQQFSLIGKYEDGDGFDVKDKGYGFGTASLFSKVLIPNDYFELTLKPSLGLPTASRGYGHRGVDLGLSLLASSALGPGKIHSGMGYDYLTDEETDGLKFNSNVFSGFTGYELYITDTFSGYFGLYISSELLDSVVKYPDYVVYYDMALSYTFTDVGRFLVGFREDPSTAGTTDISVFLEYSI